MSQEIKKIKLTSTGDKELWVVQGGDMWELPVFASPIVSEEGENFFLVKMAASYGPWFDAVAEVMNKHTVDQNGQWIIPKTKMGSIAYKAPGVTPSYYVRWQGQRQFPEMPSWLGAERIDDESSDDLETFCKFMASENQMPDTAQLKLFFTMFRDCAVKWLLDYNRRLNLGFVSLHALPVRVNWKQYLDVWIPRGTFNKSRPEIEEELHDLGFDSKLRDPILADMVSPLDTINWNIEAVTSSEWDRRVSVRENKRMQAIGKVAYAEYYKTIIDKMRNKMVAIYKGWVEKRMRKTGVFFDCGPDIGQELRASSSVVRRTPDRGTGSVVRIPITFALDPQDGPTHSIASSSLLPPLPPVQPGLPDLRDPGTGLESAGGGNG